MANALTLLVGHHEEHPACKNEWWDAGVFICLKWGVNDLHIVQLMPLPSQHFLLHYNPEWFYLYPRCPRKRGCYMGIRPSICLSVCLSVCQLATNPLYKPTNRDIGVWHNLEVATIYTHHHNLLILLSIKPDTQFTITRRVDSLE